MLFSRSHWNVDWILEIWKLWDWISVDWLTWVVPVRLAWVVPVWLVLVIIPVGLIWVVPVWLIWVHPAVTSTVCEIGEIAIVSSCVPVLTIRTLEFNSHTSFAFVEALTVQMKVTVLNSSIKEKTYQLLGWGN